MTPKKTAEIFESVNLHMKDNYDFLYYGWRVPTRKTFYAMQNMAVCEMLKVYGEKHVKVVALINAMYSNTEVLDRSKITLYVNKTTKHTSSWKRRVVKDLDVILDNIDGVEELNMATLLNWTKEYKISPNTFIYIYENMDKLGLTTNPVVRKRYNAMVKIMKAVKIPMNDTGAEEHTLIKMLSMLKVNNIKEG